MFIFKECVLVSALLATFFGFSDSVQKFADRLRVSKLFKSRQQEDFEKGASAF